MATNMVGSTSSKALGLLSDILQRFRGKDAELWEARTERMLNGKNPFEVAAEVVAEAADAWKKEIVSMVRRKLRKFFGKIKIDPVPESWTPELLAKAAAYNLLPVFQPGADINQVFQRPGWVKFQDWYYIQVANTNIKGDRPTWLTRGWYLADFTVGVDYTDGTQVMPNDPWVPLITRLRTERKIGKNENTPLGSRFAITPQEWDAVVFPAMVQELGFESLQVRMERAAEWNAIGNIYDPNRGQHNMWQWFADSFGGAYRLCGGRRVDGGLAFVDCGNASGRYGGILARPLVCFGK